MIQTIFPNGSEFLNLFFLRLLHLTVCYRNWSKGIKNALVNYLSIKHDLLRSLVTHQPYLLLMIRILARIVISVFASLLIQDGRTNWVAALA